MIQVILTVFFVFFSFAAKSADIECELRDQSSGKFVGQVFIGEFGTVAQGMDEVSKATIIFFPNTRKQTSGEVIVRYGSNLKNAYLQGMTKDDKFTGIIYAGLGDIRRLRFVHVLTFDSSKQIFTLTCN